MTGPRQPSRDGADDKADEAGEVMEIRCLGPFDHPEYFGHDVREDADEDEGWTLW